MTVDLLRRIRRGAIVLVVVSLAMAVFAGAAPAQGTSEVTEEDCAEGRIVEDGEPISDEDCQALVGQEVDLADTGFDAWVLVLAGAVLMGGAAGFVLVARRRDGASAAA